MTHGPTEYIPHDLTPMYLDYTIEAERMREKEDSIQLRYEYLRRMLNEGGITELEARLRALDTLALLAGML